MFFFFIYLGFFSRTFTNHRTAGEGGRHSINSSLPLPIASQAVTPKLFTLFSIWFSIIYISYTIHLLINSFLIMGKHSVDLILVHSLLISLQLCCFCMELLFQLFYHCSYSFFLYVIFPFKFVIFSFLLLLLVLL